MNFWVGARVRFVFSFWAILVPVTFPGLRNTAPRLTTEIVVLTHALCAVKRLI